MPQTSTELDAKWNFDGHGNGRALDFLKMAGYRLRGDWQWTLPNPLHVPTEEELSAVAYMMEQWDFGGIINSATGVAFGRGYTE